MQEEKKKVDESWKNAVQKDKQTETTQPQDDTPTAIPEANFTFFITTLAIQSSIALGEVPDPITNKQQENLDQAKYLIDTLSVIQEKTRNNLNAEEDKLLDHMLYDLRMKFSQKKAGIK